MDRILCSRQASYVSFVFGLLAITSSQSADAKAPAVRFDMVPAVVCRDVTDDAFAVMHPSERLLEARLEISSLLVGGEESDLVELFFRMVSPQQSLRIVDYSPRTTLASDYNGGIVFEEKEEKSKGVGLAITGAHQPVKINGHGDAGTKKTLTKKYELAAAMDSVAASGTIEHGFGVYFKIRQARQTNLEGSKEFQIVFRTPAEWRGDLLDVRCEAIGINRGIVRQFDEQVRCGLQDFPVALYRAGDEEAEVIAERYVTSSHQLRVIAAKSHSEIQRRSYPSMLHELGGLLDVTDPKIPKSWLRQILTGGTSGHSFEHRLPAQVQSAASNYLIAKRDLRKLKS
ncbi:MAG: hypothetical protein CMJ64_28325 [Planctomycetaceae bacterium]|nr:hypothetical protein [Planctomycetaceae bacterium]